MEAYKIVLCDYDGVMTSLQEGSYFPADVSKYALSRACAERLVQLCKSCGARVAVSSNWRKFDRDGYWPHGGSRYYNPLPAFIDAIKEVYICTLPALRHMPKAEAVAKWLDSNMQLISSYVIFDDDESEGLQDACKHSIKDRFVHVDRTFGLTDKDCERAAEILQKSCDEDTRQCHMKS